ncbi:uncharacterized protein LOC124265869 isoform X2 [Haliotis rubra]|uniref:uncharacterized protein LOC124265869 isoform X2 n=1 Tax=Haliotis rubra TaxID=36100 RepID=UPI001EE5B1EB|nr:uncharacterized protein LOC124265869 isoform X2 [Haliotis rubra]
MGTKHINHNTHLFADDDDDYGVYAISAVSFPSHIRKLLPASENHMLEYMALERARRRLRNVIIALAVFAICATLLSVSLVFGFQRREDDVPTQTPSQPKLTWETSKLQTVITRLNSSQDHSSHAAKPPSYVVANIPAYIVKSRTRCVKKCWAYSAFRFRASCHDGYCICNADNYDSLTCLPAVDTCNIRKNGKSKAVAVLKGTQQKVFGCQSDVDTESADLHVLSIFGNHRSLSTTVEVSRNSSKPAVLALVNYHPVTWKIRIKPNVNLQKVILVSYNHLVHTSVLFDFLRNTSTPKSSASTLRQGTVKTGTGDTHPYSSTIFKGSSGNSSPSREHPMRTSGFSTYPEQ